MSKYYIYNGRFYSEEELIHAFKYRYRKRGPNGKYIYYYEDDSNTGTYWERKNTTENDSIHQEYGTYTRTVGDDKYVLDRQKSNSLFSRKSVSTTIANGRKYVEKNERIGLIEQTYNKVKNKVSNWLHKLFVRSHV